MALPGFRSHTKFIRLVHLLAIPEPHALGHVEMMWGRSYEFGNPVIGDSLDVELAAMWNGKKGALTEALLNCGGKDRAGLIEEFEPGAGIYQIHDFFVHAPEYVHERARKLKEKWKVKICEFCGCEYHAGDYRSRTCSDGCRQAKSRAKKKTVQSVTVTDGHTSECDSHTQSQTVTQSHTITRPDQTLTDLGKSIPLTPLLVPSEPEPKASYTPEGGVQKTNTGAGSRGQKKKEKADPKNMSQTLTDDVFKAAETIRKNFPKRGTKQPGSESPVPVVGSKARLCDRLNRIKEQGVSMDVCVELFRMALMDYQKGESWINSPPTFFAKKPSESKENGPCMWWGEYLQTYLAEQKQNGEAV